VKSSQSNSEPSINKNSSSQFSPAILEEDFSMKFCLKSNYSRRMMSKLSLLHTLSKLKMIQLL